MMVERGLSASECPVCYDGLGQERVPYSLTCGHTVCWPCVKRLGEGLRHFSCPLCREKVPTSAVKRNVTLLQLITQLNQGMTTPFSRTLTTPFDTIELGQLLDRGASGEVYRGVWQSNDVAIKIFSSGQLSKDAHDSFHREVCIMNTLRHPNVVLLLAASPSPPRLAIVMEYVGGGSLYSHIYIDKTPLSVESMAQLLADVTRGLQYLHSINILHRDLKSKNVLLTAPPPIGRAKLCDFGLARMRLESATMTGNIGTVHWTAPEVLNCGRYHFSADIYSFGMVIYEVIARTVPFSNLPPPAVIVAVLIKRDKPVPPTDSHPTFLTLFDQCTAWEPTKRPSIISILRDLTPLVSPPSLPSQDDTRNNDGFDYTDSLGHVTIDFDLEDEEDEELLKFLQGQLDNEEEEETSQTNETNSSPPPPLERSTNNDDVFEDTRGVLSQQELDDYHNISTESSDHSTAGASTPSNDHWRRRSYMYNVPNLVPANSLRSQEAINVTPNSNVLPNHPPPLPSSSSSASFHSEMQDYLMDSDRALAMQIQMEEHKNLLKNDYVLASEMQEREQFGYRGSRPPPPPPPIPPPIPLPSRAVFVPSDQQRMVLSQVRRSGYQKRSLNHVVPVEKKPFRVGRVLDDDEVKAKEPVFTLQREIAAFSKKLLYQIDFKEPKPFFPVGKVVNNRGRVHKEINRLNSLTQSQIQNFDRNQMRYVKTDEKILLPTSEDINIERKLSNSSPPPAPPTPPPAPPTFNLEPMKFKSKILSPLKKKGGKKSGEVSPKKKMMSKSFVIEPPIEEISSKGPDRPYTKQVIVSKGHSKKYIEEDEGIAQSKVGHPIFVTKKGTSKSHDLKMAKKESSVSQKSLKSPMNLEKETEELPQKPAVPHSKVVSLSKLSSSKMEEEFVIVPDPLPLDQLTVTEETQIVHKSIKKGKKKK